MRIRMFVSAAAFAALVVVSLPLQAADGGYSCSDSETAAVATSGAVPGVGANTGPACHFVVTCPVNATGCIVNGRGGVIGVGLAGVVVLLNSPATGVVGNGCEQVGSGGCQSPNATVTLGPGQETTVHCFFSPVTSPAVAAVAVTVSCQADRTDS